METICFDFPLSFLLPPFGPALLSNWVVDGKLSNMLEFVTVFWLQETEALQMKDASQKAQATVQLAPGGTSRVFPHSHLFLLTPRQPFPNCHDLLHHLICLEDAQQHS